MAQTAGHRPIRSRLRHGPVQRLVWRTIGNAWDDEIFTESASAAFWQTLSLPPLLLGLFGVLGFVGNWFGPGTIVGVQQWIVRVTGDVFTRNAVDQIIAPTVADVLTTARGEVVSIGFVISFWSGSSAMAAFIDAIATAWDQHDLRNVVWQRTLAVLMYLVGLATGTIALPLLTLGPERLFVLLPKSWEPSFVTFLHAAYYPGIALVMVLALTTLYKVALPVKPPWYRGLPGAVLAAVVFGICVLGLRVYLDWITRTGYTYGALAAPIAFLLAMFLIAFAVIIGAHFNAAIQALWPVPLHDRRGRLAKVGGRGADPDRHPVVDVAHAVRSDPEAAAAALARLDYVVVPPNGSWPTRGPTRDRSPRAGDSGEGSANVP